MARKWFGILVLAMMTLVVANAAAQKWEVAGSVGRIFISDQGVANTNLFNSNVHFGDQLTYEANGGRRIVDIGIASLSVEVPFVFSFDQKVNFEENLVPKSFNSFFVTPSVRLNLFPMTAFSPWISGGGGWGRFDESSTLEDGGKNPGATGTNCGVAQVGLGLDVRILHGFKLRGEVRDFYSGVPQLNVPTVTRQHNIFAGGGLVWQF